MEPRKPTAKKPAEIPLAEIIGTNTDKVRMAFVRHGLFGLILDDIVRLTGLEKNSTTQPHKNLREAGVIERSPTGERRKNLNATRTQAVWHISVEGEEE
jgi:hypothetical protein